MVCDALADFEPDPSFEDTIEAARERMQQVNDHLLRTAARSLLGGSQRQHRRGVVGARPARPRSSGRATVACIDGGPAGWNS